MTTIPDEAYGLPIMRALWHLVPEEIAAPALIAWEKVSTSLGKPATTHDPWRYEVFNLPAKIVPQPWWEKWEALQADPMLRAEAERQQAFLAMTLALSERLEDGRLQGFGRVGSMLGEWKKIPPHMWAALKITFDPNFINWRHGHAIGGGVDLWGIRILDRAGLPLRAAALAYGEGPAVQTVQKFRAYGPGGPPVLEITSSPPWVPTKLDAQMAEFENPFAMSDSDSPGPEEAQLAEELLKIALLSSLKTGKLAAFAKRADGSDTTVSQGDWRRGTADIEASRLAIPQMTFEDVRVILSPLHVGDTDHMVVARSLDDLEEWFLKKVAADPAGRWSSNVDDDWAAAIADNFKVKREEIRDLYKKHLAGRSTGGRRKKLEIPPEKSATRI